MPYEKENTYTRNSSVNSSYLLRGAAAGKEVTIVISVEGDIEDVGVAVEGLLGPVAMVNVLQQIEICMLIIPHYASVTLYEKAAHRALNIWVSRSPSPQ